MSKIAVLDYLCTDTRILSSWAIQTVFSVAAIVHHAPRQIYRIVCFALSVEVSFVQTDRVSQAVRIIHIC
jgi:hypothetical protein